MESAVKIALDTNMLFGIEQFRLDLNSEINGLFPKARLFVPLQVLEELERLGKKTKTLQKRSRIAMAFLESFKVKELKVQAANADKALLLLSKNGFIIATNDKKLRKAVRESSGKCLLVRKRKFLVLE